MFAMLKVGIFPNDLSQVPLNPRLCCYAQRQAWNSCPALWQSQTTFFAVLSAWLRPPLTLFLCGTNNVLLDKLLSLAKAALNLTSCFI